MIRYPLPVAAAALLLSLAYASTCPTHTEFAIGSYTFQSWIPTSAGAGVTLARLRYGKLNTTAVLPIASSGANPSYISAAPLSLYMANENGPGSVTRARFGSHPPFVSSVEKGAESSGTTHVSHVINDRITVLKTGHQRYIYAANYNGAVSVFAQTRKHALKFLDVFVVPERFASLTRFADRGATGRQEAPHPHMVLPYQKGILVPDLGSDIVWYMTVGKMSKLEVVSYTDMTPGDGPRHAAIHAQSGTVFVVNELSLTISRLAPRCKSGANKGEKKTKNVPVLGVCGKRKLLKENAPEGTGAAAIRVTEDGRFVYASVRYPGVMVGVIVVFRVSEKTGKIMWKVGEFSSRGIHPRDFIIVERTKGVKGGCRSFVAVVNRDSDNLVLIARERHTGRLGALVHHLHVVTPTSVTVL